MLTYAPPIIYMDYEGKLLWRVSGVILAYTAGYEVGIISHYCWPSRRQELENFDLGDALSLVAAARGPIFGHVSMLGCGRVRSSWTLVPWETIRAVCGRLGRIKSHNWRLLSTSLRRGTLIQPTNGKLHCSTTRSFCLHALIFLYQK